MQNVVRILKLESELAQMLIGKVKQVLHIRIYF